MGPFEKQITVGNETYAFKLPSAKDIIEIDLKALEMRKGVTDGMGNGYSESQNVALLTQLYKGEQKVDFATLPAYVVDHLATEVSLWERSFRADLGGTQEPSSP